MRNELEQKIRKAIPELNELGVGCEIQSKLTYSKYNLILEIAPFVYWACSNNKEVFKIDIRNYEIIGKPIQLNHVLEYLFYHRKYSPSDKQIIHILERYAYLKSFQNQQSELINFINSL